MRLKDAYRGKRRGRSECILYSSRALFHKYLNEQNHKAKPQRAYLPISPLYLKNRIIKRINNRRIRMFDDAFEFAVVQMLMAMNHIFWFVLV